MQIYDMQKQVPVSMQDHAASNKLANVTLWVLFLA